MSALKAPVSRNLTSGRLLAKNTVWNFSASLAAIAIALFSVPILIKYLGPDRFGVISLVWIVEGQFSIFDLGLGQALTKLVADKLGLSREDEVPQLFWGSLLIMTMFGILAGILLALTSRYIVYHILKVPAAIQSEAVTAFHLVAFSLPIVITGAALRGLMAAYQRFDLASAIRVPISLFCYLVPLAVLPFSRGLGPFILVLVVARFLSWSLLLYLCFRISPILRRKISIKGAPFGHMLGFGGWMTVTNIVSPIMVNLDRLVIGALVSMSAVAYYATSYEAVTRLWIIPSAISTVLFPAFATALRQNRQKAALLFETGVKSIFVFLFPSVLAVVALGRFGLRIWLGPAFASHSTIVLQLLAIGVFANSLAQIPFWQIQAANRPDLAAKIHLIELPCYLCIFWVLTKAYGIEGAALAAMLRNTIDSGVMFKLSDRLLAESRPAMRRLRTLVIMSVPLFAAASQLRNMAIAIAFVTVVSAAFFIAAWRRLLTTQERELVRNPVRFLILRQSVALDNAA